MEEEEMEDEELEEEEFEDEELEEEVVLFAPAAAAASRVHKFPSSAEI